MLDKSVAIIGLGNMGGKMASVFTAAKFTVYGYDLDEKKRLSAKKQGINIVTIEDIFNKTNACILSLPTEESITDALESIVPRDGSTIIDMSTVSPAFSRKNHEKLAKKRVHYLDAPVIGMPQGAGKWTIPVGGDRQAFESVQDILSVLAAHIYYVGDSGNGATIKIVNNMISLTTWSVISEVVVLANKVGIDLNRLYEVIKSSGGGAVSPMLDRVKRIADDDFENICSVDVNIKDLKAATEMAQSLGVPVFVTASALNLHLLAKEKGLGQMDMDAIPLAFSSFKRRDTGGG
ncbi:MAG: NAD(P)-dependent oxidoreductase [Candidatus Thermoplasmatota archaeon]|nr:NAD(P)-dependent oxidoreductase [Candidatus Thermoplasmatota archaeon]